MDMSKIVDALKQVSEDRSNIVAPMKTKRTRKSWFAGILAVTVIAMLVMFNYPGGRDEVVLERIFPDEEVLPINVEYEFVQEKTIPDEGEKITQAPPEARAIPISIFFMMILERLFLFIF